MTTKEMLLEKCHRENEIINYGDADNKIEVSIKPYLTVEERATLILDIVNTLIDEETGEYDQYFFEPIMASYYITTFTDIETDSIEETWQLAKKTSILDDIYDVVGDDAYAIRTDVKEMLDDMREKKKAELGIAGIMKKLNGILDKVQNAIPENSEAFEKMLSAFNLAENTDIQSVVSSILAERNDRGEE